VLIVPGHGGEEPDQHHRPDVELSGAGVDRGRDQDSLARNGDPEVLEEQ
jgi:hypothetical protein